jgi:hypothetical protein
VYNSLYTQCLLMMSKWVWIHVEAINHNKLEANSASCWSHYIDIINSEVRFVGYLYIADLINLQNVEHIKILAPCLMLFGLHVA